MKTRSCGLLLIILFIAGLDARSQTSQFPDELSRAAITNADLNAVAYQFVERKTFSKFKNSTAFFITKNCLLTSAHNVTKLLIHSVRRIELTPSRIRSEKPFGTIELAVDYDKNIAYSNKYSFGKESTHPSYDLALIYIPDGVIDANPKLSSLAYLPILEAPEVLHKGDTIYAAGYPAEGKYKDQYIMTMDTSVVESLSGNSFTHGLETLKGNSGSPIMVKRNNRFYVVGVNSIRFNGTWINAARQKEIKEWIRILEERNQFK